MKKVVAALACAALGFALTGCGGAAEFSAASAGSTTEQQTAVTREWSKNGFTFSYPESWVTTDDNDIFFTAIAEKGDASGGLLVAMASESTGLSTTDDDEHLKSWLNLYTLAPTALLENSGISFELGDEVSYENDGRIACLVSEIKLTNGSSGSTFSGLCKVSLNQGGVLGLVLSAYADGSDVETIATAESIVDSATLEPSAEASQDGNSETGAAATTEEGCSSISDGTYKVGTDVVAGEYRLTANSGTRGYWKVTLSSGANADIVDNDNFEGSTYLTVSDGQYLTLSRCTAELAS